MIEELKASLAKARSGPWWAPERVKNQRQVDFIIMQANHFGAMSAADRFLQDCKAAGVIEEGKLRMREPGEDD